MSEWQTMETAPKDGTQILLFVEDLVTQGWWDGKYWKKAWLNSHGCGCCGSRDDEPTHWKPFETPA